MVIHKFRILILAAGISICFSASTDADQRIVDTEYGFTLQLRDGFVLNKDLVQANPNIIHAFTLGDLTDENPDIVLMIEDLGGTIGRERLTEEQMPPGFRGRLFTTKWQGFVVDGIEVPEKSDGIDLLTFNVQIPLKRKAIQVKLAGPSNRKRELNVLLNEILQGLQGESNWFNSVVKDSSKISEENYKVILIVAAIVIILGGLVGYWIVSNYCPNGLVLGLAVVIYAVGVSLANTRIRELLLVGGSMKMLGCIGVVIGLIDLFRKKKPKKQDR